jgi:hypothetical protein
MLISVAQPYYPMRFKITKQKLPKASSLLTNAFIKKILENWDLKYIWKNFQ